MENRTEYIATQPHSASWVEARFVHHPFFQLSNEINLYGENKVMMVMFQEKEMIGCIIKSKMLHQTLSSLFDLSWELGKKE